MSQASPKGVAPSTPEAAKEIAEKLRAKPQPIHKLLGISKRKYKAHAWYAQVDGVTEDALRWLWKYFYVVPHSGSVLYLTDAGGKWLDGPSPEVIATAREIAGNLRDPSYVLEIQWDDFARVDPPRPFPVLWLWDKGFIHESGGRAYLTDAGGKWLDAQGICSVEDRIAAGFRDASPSWEDLDSRIVHLSDALRAQPPAAPSEAGEIRAYYVNHEGVGRVRHLRPLGLRWGSTEWHPEEGLLIRCIDLETGAEREFSDAFAAQDLVLLANLAMRATPPWAHPGMLALLTRSLEGKKKEAEPPADPGPSKGAIIWDFCERIAKRALDREATAGASIPADCLVDAVIAIGNFRAGWIGAEELAAARQETAPLARDGNALAAVVCAAAGGQIANASNAAATHAARIYSEDMGSGEQIAQLEDLLAILGASDERA